MKREKKTVRQTNGNSKKNRNPPFLKVIFSLSVDIMNAKNTNVLWRKTEEKNNEEIPRAKKTQ